MAHGPGCGRLAVLIPERAEEVGHLRAYIGWFEFAAFAALRKQRLIVRLGDGQFDVISTLAPQVTDATWKLAPFRVQVVCC